jgi:hypothetical protein
VEGKYIKEVHSHPFFHHSQCSDPRSKVLVEGGGGEVHQRFVLGRFLSFLMFRPVFER